MRTMSRVTRMKMIGLATVELYVKTPNGEVLKNLILQQKGRKQAKYHLNL